MSRARNLAVLALLTITATVVVIGGPSAFARWQTVVTGGAHSRQVLITGARVTGLYPGASKELTLSLHNTNRRRRVAVRGIHVRTVATTKRSCSPSRRNLRIQPYTGPPLWLAPGGTRRIALGLLMPYTVANACQRAVFKLRYSAEVFAARRR